MGGALAQVIAGRHPERLAGLVLCSTAARWHASTIERVFYAGLGRANLKLRPHARARVANRLAALPEVPIVVTPGSDLSDWAWAEFRSTSAWSLVEALDELGRFDARGWLPDVTAPTAVVVTARDRAIATARQREMAALIPDARVYDSPGGHASIVFDAAWRPIFLDAVTDVLIRSRVPV